MMGNAYPNPASTSFSLEYSGNVTGSAKLVVQNLIGIKVREEVLAGTNDKSSVDVSGLPDGIYLYSLEVEGKMISTKKLVVRH